MKFYKHDIPDWRDSTGTLSNGAYRVYHVIIETIYMHEGPIQYNERGLAGVCNMRIDRFRRYFNELVADGYVTYNDGIIDQYRCHNELITIRQSNSKRSNTLKNKGAAEVSPSKEKTRQEKTRLDKTRVITRSTTASPQKGSSVCSQEWFPSIADQEWAVGQGFTAEQIRHARDEMVDWSQAGNKRRHKWGAVWRNWLRRDGKRASPARKSNLDIAFEQMKTEGEWNDRTAGVSDAPGGGRSSPEVDGPVPLLGKPIS